MQQTNQNNQKKIYKTTFHLDLTETVSLNRFHEVLDFLKAQALEEMKKDGIELSNNASLDAMIEVNIYTEEPVNEVQCDKM